MKDLTQAKLKSILDYCPETGVFTWRNRSDMTEGWNRLFAGKVAGSLNKGKRTNYIRIKINSVGYKAHRLAWLYMYGEIPEQIDHNDRDGTNNKLSNLSAVNNQQNQRNQRKPRNNTSGCIGVYFRAAQRRWRAAIRVDDQLLHLGQFPTIFEAACARKSAEIRYGFSANHGI